MHVANGVLSAEEASRHAAAIIDEGAVSALVSGLEAIQKADSAASAAATAVARCVFIAHPYYIVIFYWHQSHNIARLAFCLEVLTCLCSRPNGMPDTTRVAGRRRSGRRGC